MGRFIRFFDTKNKKEILLNSDHITKVEVRYGIPFTDQSGEIKLAGLPLKQAMSDERAVRWYTVFFGSESFHLPANPDDPISKVVQSIYDNAIKSPGYDELPPTTVDQ